MAKALIDPQFFCLFEIDNYTQSIGSTLLISFHFIKDEDAKDFFIQHVQNMINDAIKKNLPLNLDALLLMSCYKNISSLIKFFVDKDADVNAVAENGSTPLIFAADCNNFAIVKLLTEKGADVFMKNNFNKAALEYAMAGSQTQMYLMRYINGKRKQQDDLTIENNTLKQKLAAIEAELTELRVTTQVPKLLPQPVATGSNLYQDKHLSDKSDDSNDDSDTDSDVEVVYRRGKSNNNQKNQFGGFSRK